MPPSVLNSCWRELMLMLDLLVVCIICATARRWMDVAGRQPISTRAAARHFAPNAGPSAAFNNSNSRHDVFCHLPDDHNPMFVG